MPLTTVQKNVLDELQTLAIISISLKSRLRNVVEMYGNEGISQLTDADVQELDSFKHITVSELQGAKNGLDAIATVIGEYVVGTPATKLLKIVPNIPIT